MDAVKDYGQDVETIKQFLKEFTHVDGSGEVVPKYVPMLIKIANREEVCLFVELADLEQYNHTLAEQVTGNTMRYTQLFYEALDELLPTFKTVEPAEKDIMDVFIEQRLFVSERNQRANQDAGGNQQQQNSGATTQTVDINRMNRVDIDGKYPPDLIRRSEIYFKPATFEAIPVRDVKAAYIGKLVTIRGIVTRATDVKPKITVATYTCDQCGCETFQPVRGPFYTPLIECSSAACKSMKTLGSLNKQTRGSKFVKFQEIKLQEHSDQVPTGHIPRTITVQAHGELTRRCVPGNHISLTGVFLPLENSGFNRMRAGGNISDTYIEAHYITQMNKTEDFELDSAPLSEEAAAQLINGQENFLDRLSKSIAPEIFGHTHLKKALLLLLVGGTDKVSYGMKIRGNINICLMGDPGVAKSQLLSFIDRLAIRSQYTTGRGSSGVGLTAAVLKDPITNELVLEGGALVLADRGICCIDEFDKMMDADRTAIHEVMEQQTVSIAKAGIMTTLNARVSILAAANPSYGRYNIHRSISDNLQLPPALLSRFDLIWLIRDAPEKEKDLNLAEHIMKVHSNPDRVNEEDSDCIDMQTMRRYISLCQLKNPTIVDRNLTNILIETYLSIRDKKRTHREKDSLFTSPRSLLAIIRLSTAFARLRLADEVEEKDIKAAVELYNNSRESIEGGLDDPVIEDINVMKILRSIAYSLKARTVPVNELKEALHRKGFKASNLVDTLLQLERFDFITFDKASEDITLVDEVNEADLDDYFV